MNPGIRIGSPADFALDRLIVRERIAVCAEQRLARGPLELPFIGLCPALPEIALAVVEMEPRDHAVAIEGDIVAQARRILRVGLYAVKCPVQFPWDGAPVSQTMNVGFDARRSVETREARRLGIFSHTNLYVTLTIIARFRDAKAKRDTDNHHAACGRR